MEVFIVVGTIGGDFLPHPDKEIVKVFADENKAKTAGFVVKNVTLNMIPFEDANNGKI